MPRTIQIDRNPYCESNPLYDKSRITLKEGVTFLVGCNGSGKTTLLNALESKLNAKKIPCYHHNNAGIDDRRGTFEKAILSGNTATAASIFCSSEGEGLCISMNEMAKSFGNFVLKHPDMDECWLLIDAADTSLSVDNIQDFVGFYDFLLSEYPPAEHVYIILAGNSYEFAKSFPCFDVKGGKYVQFGSYEDYRQFVLESRYQKDKRLE